MYEIEIKARAQHETVRKKLINMGAIAVETEKHLDIYYNSPYRDFCTTDEALRIRSVNGKSILTYKGKKIDTVSKTRPEYETEVDGESAREILNALGFIESGVVSKQREIFKFDNLTIALDHVDDLGDFIEVEKQAMDNVEAHLCDIFDFLKNFDIKPEDSITTSYLEMVQKI